MYKITGTHGGARSTIQNSEWRPGGGPRTRPFTAADFSARATYNTTIESSDGSITYGMDYPFCTWNDEEWMDNCATLYVRCKRDFEDGILPDCTAGPCPDDAECGWFKPQFNSTKALLGIPGDRLGQGERSRSQLPLR